MIARKPSVVVASVIALTLAGAASAEDRAALEQRVQASAWSEASWRDDVTAAASLARLTHPRAEERLRSLEGLAPERYLLRRRPEPEASRELTRLVRRDEVPPALLADLLVRGAAEHPLSTEDRLAKLGAKDPKRLARMEREQLTAALLLALAESRHESAFHAVRMVLDDERRPLAERNVAAVALGKTRDERALAVLSSLVRSSQATDAKAPVELRTSALAGLGQLRSPAAVRALAELSRSVEDATLLRATALSLGNAASAWALRRTDADVAATMRAAAADALVDLVERSADALVVEAAIDALGMVAHAPAKARLRALADDARSSDALRERARRAERRLERALVRNAR